MEDMVQVEEEEEADMVEEAIGKMIEEAVEVDTTSRIVEGISLRGAAEVATETGGITEVAAVEGV